MTYPVPSLGTNDKGSGPNGVTAGGDAPSAKLVILAALQSGDGIARFAADGAGNAHEVAALAVITNLTTDDIGAHAAAIVNEALGAATVTAEDHWDDIATAIAAFDD